MSRFSQDTSTQRASTPGDDHVAWCRYVTAHGQPTRIVLCDSDTPGAFPVCRKRPEPELAAIAATLPGTYYMDPPDGGSVALVEQFQRMARDAQRYRWLRGEAPPHSLRWPRWQIGYWDGTVGAWRQPLHDDMDRLIDAERAADKGA